MFGLLKGCGCGLGKEGRKNWNSHVCGLCFSLKDTYGQIYRCVTNYDAPLITVLSEAQLNEPLEKTNIFCPLHRPWKQTVISPANLSSKFAASMSLLIAAVKINDHIDDGDIWYLPKMIKNLTKKWIHDVRINCEKIGLSVDFILEQLSRQPELERHLHKDFYFYSKPTELSVACAFSSTSVISGNNRNSEGLFKMGEMYGRLMYLLDSYKDYDSDLKYKKFNPLAQQFNKEEIKDYVRSVYLDTIESLKKFFNSLELPDPSLAHKLFFHELSHIGNKIIYCADGPDSGWNGNNQQPEGYGTYYDPNYQPPAPYDQDPTNMKKHKKDGDGCCDACDDCNCCNNRCCCNNCNCCNKNSSNGCCDYTCCHGCPDLEGCNFDHCNICHSCDTHSCCHGCDCHGCDCNCCDCNGCDCN